MVASGSLFGQLLRHFPKSEFVRLASEHGVERFAKGFKSWTHFVAMLFCQLARAVSLREICNGLACCLGKLVLVGTTENALLVQIWTALIAMLLLKWLHHLSKAGWSLSNMAAMLRMNLFTYRDLEEWLNNPLGTPPLQPAPIQLALALPGIGQQPSPVRG